MSNHQEHGYAVVRLEEWLGGGGGRDVAAQCCAQHGLDELDVDFLQPEGLHHGKGLPRQEFLRSDYQLEPPG